MDNYSTQIKTQIKQSLFFFLHNGQLLNSDSIFGLDTSHLLVKVPQPGESKVTFCPFQGIDLQYNKFKSESHLRMIMF